MAQRDLPNNEQVKLPEPEAVVTSTSRTKSHGLKAWKDVFIAVNRDEFEQTFTEKLLQPAMRDLAIRLAHGAIDILANGVSGVGTYYGPYNNPNNQNTPYHRMSGGGAQKQALGKTAAGYSLDEVGFDTYDEAITVLSKLNAVIAEYGIVDVYSFYVWAAQPADFTDKDWGWEKIIDCKPLLRRDGQYFLPLPRPKNLRQR